VKTEAEVLELLGELVSLQNHDPPLLTESEAEAFPDMLDRAQSGRSLSARQMEWILGAAERLSLSSKKAENLFSSLPEQRQRAERARAAAVVLPWEKGAQTRPLKPPGRP
jgi:hypothetical protein